MNRSILAIALAIATSTFPLPLLAQNAPQDKVDIAPLMAPVLAWANAFSTQQLAFPANAFTDDCVVIDNFPPFVWASPNSGIRQWYASVEGADSPADREHVLKSKETVELSAPQNVAVRDGKAYMTFSATWRGLSRSGKRFTQGAVFTVIERQTDAGWRIEAHSWGQLTTVPE